MSKIEIFATQHAIFCLTFERINSSYLRFVRIFFKRPEYFSSIGAVKVERSNYHENPKNQ